MKKTALLNAPLSRVVASMGHRDLLVLADAGLPIPPGVPVIDLAVSPGIPTLASVLRAVLAELQIEAFYIAKELEAGNAAMAASILADMPVAAKRIDCSHEEFKRITSEAKVIVRTGEFTPYANVILRSGVLF